MTVAVSTSEAAPPRPPLGPLHSDNITRGDQLWQLGRTEAALAAYRDELDSEVGDHFTRGFAHKRIVSLLVATEGIDRAFSEYRLARVDDRDLSIEPHEILCCATVRDEADRLEFFLDYYERLGVDRFLLIDNESRDETRELLLDRPNTHLWRSDMHYARANYGMAWVEVVLRAYGRAHWCLVVDADELLYYPDVETRSLRDLCASLDERGAVALPTVLLDMYSGGPLREAMRHPGSSPLDVCRFFDRDFSHSHQARATPWENIDGFSGGVRRRVFGENTDVFLSKVPLVRYADDRILFAGMHGTNAPRDKVSWERGALLHFKFTARFVERLEEEIHVAGRATPDVRHAPRGRAPAAFAGVVARRRRTRPSAHRATSARAHAPLSRVLAGRGGRGTRSRRTRCPLERRRPCGANRRCRGRHRPRGRRRRG